MRRKISSWLQAEFEAGCVAYRDFDFHRADENYQSKGAAAYGQQPGLQPAPL